MEKKRVRRYLLWICLFLFSAITIEAKAAWYGDWKTFGGDFTWTDSAGVVWRCVENSTGEAAVYGCSNAPMELQIPEYVYQNGSARKVTAVVSKEEAFGKYYWESKTFYYSGKESGWMLYTISFPDTVNYIGIEAFSCRNSDEMLGLAGIILPQNPNLEIAGGAFYGCNNLQQITFRVKAGSMQPVKIGEEAFCNCKKLTEITLPPTGARNKINSSAFAGCSGLKKIVNAPGELDFGDVGSAAIQEIYIAEGVTGIGGVSLSKREANGDGSYSIVSIGIPTLTKVVLPSTAKEIERCAFENASSLQTINLPKGLTRIGEGAFRGCVSLSGFTTLPSSVTEIGSQAFMGCKNLKLTNVKIHDAVDYQFKDSGIVSATIAADVRLFYGGSFSGCENLKEINVEAGNSGFSSKAGIVYANVYSYYTGEKVGKSLFIYPAGKSYTGSYTIPNDVCGVGAFAFDSCKFTEIHIPVTVEFLFSDYMASLGDMDTPYYAFDNMKNPCTIYLVKHSYVAENYSGRLGSGNAIRYEAGPSLSISYVLNGGVNNASNPKSIAGGSTISLKAPTRTGYTFLGWKKGSGTNYVTSYTPSYAELYNGVTFTAEWKKKEANITSLGQVGVLKLTNAQNTSMKATYSKISGATGYHILASTSKTFKTGNKSFYSKKTSYVLKGLKTGKTYYVKVRAYYKNGSKTIYGKYSKTMKLATISVGKAGGISAKNVAGKKISVTLAAVKGAKGYQFTVATDKKFTKNVKTVYSKNRTAAITKLTKGKTYYVRGRAYKLNAQKQKVYGAYSKIVKVTVRK